MEGWRTADCSLPPRFSSCLLYRRPRVIATPVRASVRSSRHCSSVVPILPERQNIPRCVWWRQVVCRLHRSLCSVPQVSVVGSLLFVVYLADLASLDAKYGVNDQFQEMSDFNICQEKIEEKLQQLNTAKSPGPGCLHPRVLYETHAGIAYPLYLLYAKSL